VAELVDVLRERGLLPLADDILPSLTTLVAGEPIRGSWWGHATGHEIFHAATALGHHRDVLVVRLISGKVTFVHRRLWPALLAVALSREPWQTAALSPQARALLKRLERAGELQAVGPAVRELERRLLIKTSEIHTKAGAHAKIAEPWDRWARRLGVKPLTDLDRARRTIEAAVMALARDSGPRPKLPWPTATRASSFRRASSTR
jgi:hypothetical protein